MSNRVMNLLSNFTPEIEVYSIDEAFLKFDGFRSDFNYKDYGKQIRYAVTKGTGIPVSIGIAPTKSLAKVANKVAKKFPEQTEGVHIIDSDEMRIKALKWLPVEDVWGIGRRHAIRLNKINVKTAYDFSLLPETWVKQHMSIVGLRLHKELNGVKCLDIDLPASKKMIATTRSFDKNYSDKKVIKERVTTYAVTCAEKLRKQNSCCSALMVFIISNRHRKDLPQYSKNIIVNLPFPTNSSIEVAKYAVEGFERIFRVGYEYKKAGVIVMEITPERNRQTTLFGQSDERHAPLMIIMDNINKSIGVKKIKLGGQDLDRTWKMKQEKLSPRFSTKLKDVIKIKAAEF